MNAPATDNEAWQRDVLAHLRGTTSARPAYRSTPDLSALAERPRRLHRQISDRPAMSRTHRWGRVLAGVLQGDEEPSARVAALERLQLPVATGRRVIVSGAHGGAGATTIALALMQVLHAHRRDGVVLLDGAGNAGGLLSRLSTAPTMSVAAADRHLEQGRVEAVLPPHLRPHQSVLAPAASHPDVAAQVAGKVQRHVAFTVIDAGAGSVAHEKRSVDLDVDDPTDRSAGTRSSVADCVVVVAENTVRGLLCVHARIREHAAQGVPGQRIMVAIVERVLDSGVTTCQLRREVQRVHDVPMLVLPRDRHLAGGAQLRGEHLAAGTSTAITQIAAEVVWRSGQRP